MLSFDFYILLHLTLWVACMHLESPLVYNMYVFNLWIANRILIKVIRFTGDFYEITIQS